MSASVMRTTYMQWCLKGSRTIPTTSFSSSQVGERMGSVSESHSGYKKTSRSLSQNCWLCSSWSDARYTTHLGRQEGSYSSM
jgi:hypothetical protein